MSWICAAPKLRAIPQECVGVSTIIINRLNDMIKNYHMDRGCGNYLTSNIFGV